MTQKNRKGIIITIIGLMVILSPILISSISGISHLKGLKYLIDNGNVVTGRVVSYSNTSGYTGTGWGYGLEFTLYYQYQEDDTIWKTSKRISGDRAGKNKQELESWCKDQIGASIELIIADNGYCEPLDDVNSIYNSTYEFVYVRGGIVLFIEIALFIGFLILFFYKPKNKNQPLNF